MIPPGMPWMASCEGAHPSDSPNCPEFPILDQALPACLSREPHPETTGASVAAAEDSATWRGTRKT